MISVTQENINTGVRKNSKKCPIALAVKEQLKAKDVNVYNGRIEVEYRGKFAPIEIYVFSPLASLFLWQFDAGFDVEPIKFELLNPTFEEMQNIIESMREI